MHSTNFKFINEIGSIKLIFIISLENRKNSHSNNIKTIIILQYYTET